MDPDSSEVNMENKQDQAVSICAYEEAMESFNKLNISHQSTSGVLTTDDNLYQIVCKLCLGEPVEVEENYSLFYQTIIYSDFIQIKQEYFEEFFTGVWKLFSEKDTEANTLMNIRKLDKVQHLKKYIARGLFKILHLKPTITNGTLEVTFDLTGNWYDIDFENIHAISFLPNASKKIDLMKNFKMAHLNLLLIMFEVKELYFSRFDLVRDDLGDLFKGLNLDILQMKMCYGVSKVILEHSPYFLHLKKLLIPGNTLMKECLKKIRMFPLETLDLGVCLQMNPKTTFKRVSLNTLWETGNLRKTIKTLNLKTTIFENRFLKQISQLKLVELDLSSCHEPEHLNFVFPPTLKILNMQSNKINLKVLKAICKLSLVKLDLHYVPDRTKEESFDDLLQCPLLKSLKSLAIRLEEFQFGIITFFANADLEEFRFYRQEIEHFILVHPEKRKKLKVLQWDGDIGLRDDVLHAVSLLNLTELTFTCAYFSTDHSELLSCELLQKSLVKLTLLKRSVINIDLKLLRKFKKLQELTFSFSYRVTPKHLKRVVTMKNLKTLDITAVIDQSLPLHLAKCICIAPVKTLTIETVCEWRHSYMSMSKEAAEYLSIEDNVSQFCDKIKFLNLYCPIECNLAEVLKNAHWEIIKIRNWKNGNNSMDILFSKDHLCCSLSWLKVWHNGPIGEELARLNLDRFRCGIDTREEYVSC